ncbi:hypothetical protein HAX54_024904 [Datura stramonium]|uniref:Uncharacterized protein n=1 Tax=Datura stramonium TaxID=4076 RepID=A0ABS8S5R6_DATST|nr:hypothetical protein [Datura stramonium]
MLPPRQQPRPGGLQTSLSLVDTTPDACGSPNPHERGSTSDQAKRKRMAMLSTLLSAICQTQTKCPLRDIARERIDVIADRMRNLPDEYLEKFKHELRVILEGLGVSQHRDEFLFTQRLSE